MNKKKGTWSMALSFGLNNLLAVVVCLLIMTLFGFILSSKFSWIMYALMLVSFCFLVYHQAWQYGSRDLDNGFGCRTDKALNGALIATVPNFVMAVISVLIDMGIYAPLFKLSNQAFVIAAYRFWNMSFRLLFDYLEAVPALYFIPCIAMPVFAVLGYIFGYKRLKISDYLYYEREKNE